MLCAIVNKIIPNLQGKKINPYSQQTVLSLMQKLEAIYQNWV